MVQLIKITQSEAGSHAPEGLTSGQVLLDFEEGQIHISFGEGEDDILSVPIADLPAMSDDETVTLGEVIGTLVDDHLANNPDAFFLRSNIPGQSVVGQFDVKAPDGSQWSVVSLIDDTGKEGAHLYRDRDGNYVGIGVFDNDGNNANRSDLLMQNNGLMLWNNARVWTAGNHGPGSGMNADLLDGVHASEFLRRNSANGFITSFNEFLDAVTRFRTPQGFDLDSATTHAMGSGLEVFQVIPGADALLSFHISGDFGAHFGIDGGTNDLVFGGWSHGLNVKHKVWHSGNDGAGSGMDADLLDGIHASQFLRKDGPSDSYGGNSLILTHDDPYIRRNRNDQHLVLSGGDGWAHSGAVSVLRGATSGYNAHGLELYTGNAESLKIAANGNIFLPRNAVSRFARSTGSEELAHGAHVGLDAANLNRGGFYHGGVINGNQKGVHCPSTGTYLFILRTYFEPASSGHFQRLAVIRNGNGADPIVACSRDVAGGVLSVTDVALQDMNEGDWFSLYVPHGPITAYHWINHTEVQVLKVG